MSEIARGLVGDSNKVNISTLSVNDTFIDGGRVLKVIEVRTDGMRISEVVGLASDEEIAEGAVVVDSSVVPIPVSTDAQSAPRRKSRGSRK